MMPRPEFSISSLEPRWLLAVSPVDTSWHFSQTAIDKAAGVHVNLSMNPVAGARERLMFTGYTGDYYGGGQIVIVALTRDGSLDPSFAGDGVAMTGIANGNVYGAPTLKFLSTPDGYSYLITDSGVTRFRGDGVRDRAFGGGRAVDWTGGRATNDTLSAAVNDVGGVDILRTVHTPNGKPRQSDYGPNPFDGVTELIRVSGVGPRGGATVVWSESFTDGQTDAIPPDVLDGSLTELSGGGWVVLAARQHYFEPAGVDSSFPGELNADVDVLKINSVGVAVQKNNFDIGRDAIIDGVKVHSRGDYIIFTYGTTRQLTVARGRFMRETLAVGLGTPGLPNGQTMVTQNHSITDVHGKTVTSEVLNLMNANGRVDTNFASGGAFKLTDYATAAGLATPGNASSGDGEAIFAQPGSVVIGWQTLVGDYPKVAFVTNLIRLWTGNGPTSTLVSNSTRGSTATFTVRYRAAAGIAPRTIGSPDIDLLGSASGWVSARLINILTDGDSVLATYRAAGLAKGSYSIQLSANQIGTGNGGMNTDYRILGELHIG